MQLDLTEPLHRYVHLSVPPRSKIAMSATRARTAPFPVANYWIDWTHGPTAHGPGLESNWATEIMQRCVVRFQPLGSQAMDYVFGQQENVTPGNYGFTLRDTELGPTAFPQDFDAAQLPPSWCYDEGFELFFSCHCGDQNRFGVWRNYRWLSENSWCVEISDENPAYRNAHQPYDYLVFLAVQTEA